MNYEDCEINEDYIEREKKNIELCEACWFVIKICYHVLAVIAIYRWIAGY